MIGIQEHNLNDPVTKIGATEMEKGVKTKSKVGLGLHSSPNTKSHINKGQLTEMDIDTCLRPNLTSSPRRQLSSISSSGESIDWCTLMEEDDRRLKIINKDLQKHKEKLARYEKSGLPTDGHLFQIEGDEVVLVRRQKQLEYGRNTQCYEKYRHNIPKRLRKRGQHPSSPNKFQVCSRRSWDSQIRIWRRNLHEWDPSGVGVKGQRMQSSDAWSDASSENDRTMDQESSSLDTSVTSSGGSGMTASNEGSRSTSPLTVGQDDNKVPSAIKPGNDGPPSYATITAKNSSVKPSLSVHIPAINPKTPTGTPAEDEVAVDPAMSSPPFNPTELLEALQRVGISPSQLNNNNQRHKNNRKSLVNKFSEMSRPDVASGSNESKDDDDMKELEACWE